MEVEFHNYYYEKNNDSDINIVYIMQKRKLIFITH